MGSGSVANGIKFRSTIGTDFDPMQPSRSHFDFVKPDEMRFLKNADEVRASLPIESMVLSWFDRFPMQPALPTHHRMMEADHPYYDDHSLFVCNMLQTAAEYHRMNRDKARVEDIDERFFARWLTEFNTMQDHGKRMVAAESMRILAAINVSTARAMNERAVAFQARIERAEVLEEVRRHVHEAHAESAQKEREFRHQQSLGVAQGMNQNRPRGKK